MSLSQRRISRLGWTRTVLPDGAWRWTNPENGSTWDVPAGEEPSLFIPHFQGVCQTCFRRTTDFTFKGCAVQPCPHGFQENEDNP
jgi:hypothetical protein